MKQRLPGHLRPTLPPPLDEALELYNIMGGLDWQGLPLLFQLYDITDPERMLERLAMIRNEVNKPRDDGTRPPHQDHR